MKHVVGKLPSNQIQIKDVGRAEILAMVGKLGSERKKYVLTASPASPYFRFSNGETIWTSSDYIDELMQSVLNDHRVKVYAFSSTEELAKWLSSGAVGEMD